MIVSPVLRRALASLLAGALATALGVGAYGGSAMARPRPSLDQVQRQVDALNHQAEQAAERYNTARVELDETARQLRAVRSRFESQQRSFAAARVLVGRLAAAAYKEGTLDRRVALFLSEDPATVLHQASTLERLSRQQGSTLRTMATVRLRLAQDRAALREQQARAAALKAELAAERRSVEAKLDQARGLLAALDVGARARLRDQRRAAEDRALEAREGAMRASRDAREGTFPTYDGPVSGRAAEAVKAAYAQLGDPYAWGAAGPNSFDCSGLTMYSWAAAGVSLPHSSAAQFAALPHVAVENLEPGDLVFYYSPISHVALYIGGGKVIDAPYPGRSVHIVGLYSMPFVGAARP